MMSAVLAGGGRVGVVRDADEILGLLNASGIPRARRLALRGTQERIAGAAVVAAQQLAGHYHPEHE
jgi:hypothetical protein